MFSVLASGDRGRRKTVGAFYTFSYCKSELSVLMQIALTVIQIIQWHFRQRHFNSVSYNSESGNCYSIS